MKIAVYTIAKNEEQFVESWYNSAKDADYLLIADTGSTDNTVELAKSLGINVINVNVSPWRFDDARNASLAAIPLDIDYCIALDMDEVLIEGWREELEKVNPQSTRIRYQYTWNWNEDGTPGLQYGGDKIHSRKGYRWKHPVHEVLFAYGFDEIQEWCGMQIHHHADDSKPRSQYYPLLAIAVREDPHDDRNAFYYARELFFNGQIEKAVEEFKRHLDLPSAKWGPERAQSMRYLAKCEADQRESWLLKAIQEAPGRREPIVDLSLHYYTEENWDKCLEYINTALDITEKPLDYLCEAEAWGWLPYDLKAISEYNLGNIEAALDAGLIACSMTSDERLASNLAFYKKAYNTENAIM